MLFERWERWTLRKDPRISIEEGRAEKGGLKKALGWLDLTALGIGAIIGAGIFVLAGQGAAVAGSGIVLSVIFAGFVCAFVGLCYAELAAAIPASGSAYSYTYSTMGELVAWILGWALVLEYAVGSVAVAISWSGYFQGLLKQAGWALPPEISSSPWSGGGVVNLPAVLIVLVITALLVVGVKESARVTAALVALKVGVLVFVIALGLFLVRPENLFHSPLPSTTPQGSPIDPVTAVVTGAALFFFAYIGFDAVSTAAEETRNPKRDLPVGILLSLGISTLLYVLAATVLVGMQGWEVFHEAARPGSPLHGILSEPFGFAFEHAGLPWAAAIIRAGAVAGITSVLLVLLLGAPRIFFALSRDGLFPRGLSAVHPKFKTPHRTTILTGAAVALAAGFLPLENAVHITNIGTLFAFVLVCLGVVVLRRTDPDLPRPYRVPFSPFFPLLGALGSLYLAWSLGSFTHFVFVGWMGLGIVLYSLYGVRKSRLALPESPASSEILVPLEEAK